MIQASELRIGNWVKVGENETVIDLIDCYSYSKEIVHCEGNGITNRLDQIKGIQLTEEWVKKCIFKFKELGFDNLSVSVGLIGGEIHFVIDRYYVKLEYVHSLQNLYFALTGKELKIK